MNKLKQRQILPPQWALAILFFLQATFFAYYITPLADIPDESGHFAYVADISKGRPLPVLGITHTGRGYIPDNLWKNWGEESPNKRVNYIVQHPPLYYFFAAIPYSISKQFTDNKNVHAYAARSVSAISLGLLILVTFKTLTSIKIPNGQAILISSWLPLLPMMTHLSSGITNDVFLVLMCSLATLYLIKFLNSQHIKFAYYCAFWLAAAGATKMTAWILIAAYIGIILFELRKPLKLWAVHCICIVFASTSTALLWMYRNYIAHGNPFHVFEGPPITNPQGVSLINYFQNYPFFDWLIQHSYGLVGFSGYCLSAKSVAILKDFCTGAQMTSASGPSFWIFIYSIAALGSALTISYFSQTITHRPLDNELTKNKKNNSVQSIISDFFIQKPRLTKLFNIILIAVAVSVSFIFIRYGFKFSQAHSLEAYFAMGAFIIATILLLRFMICSQSIDQRILSYGPIIFALFILSLFLKSHSAFDVSGQLPGVQGRYLFPFYPLLIASFGVALRNQAGLILSAIITAGLLWAHLNAYTDIFIPFFNSVKL